MKIEYFGHACFRITAANGKRIVTDPYQGVGYSLPRGLTGDIITVSHGHFDHNNVAAVSGNPIVLDKSGEFIAHEISFVGAECFHDPKQGALRGKNIIFTFLVDGIKICHLGDIGEEVRAELLQKIGKPDVLLLPIGGKYTIDEFGAKAYVQAIQPKVAIPMHYKPKDGTLDIAAAEDFLNLYEKVTKIGANAWEIHASDLKREETEILFMEKVEK
jgi:L-ascorbate metabolism protein UlaG (beta-lactamase superfamily)